MELRRRKSAGSRKEEPMKRWILFVLFAAAVTLLCLPALADTDAATVEDVAACLQQCREERTGDFTINCTKELFDILSADRFSPLMRMCYAVGMEDPKIRYSASGTIQFEGITYSDLITYGEAESMAEAEKLITGWVEAGAEGFVLSCSEDVYSALWNDRGMYSLLARLGIEDFKLSGSSSDRMCYVEKMKRFKTPWAVAEDIFAAGNIIASWRDEGAAAFSLVFDREVFDGMNSQALRMIEFLGGIDECSTGKNTYSCCYTFKDVTWKDTPSAYCSTEEELVNAIRGMGAQGIRDFELMLDESLWESVKAKSFARLYELHAQAGLSQTDLSYSSAACLLVYSNASITSDVTVLSDPAEVREYLSACAAREDQEISLFLTEEMYDSIMEGVSSFRLVARDTGLYDLAAQAGIFQYGISCNRGGHVVTINNIEYFPGLRIVHAAASGEEASLPPRLQETLTAARVIVQECAGTDPADTARRIHDRICEMVVYTDDESTDEDDCCIGARSGELRRLQRRDVPARQSGRA